MDIKKNIRRLKPYKAILFVSFLLSGIIGLALFLLKKDRSMIIIGSLLPLLSSLFQILFLEREFASILTFSLIILSVTYYSSFKFFKKALIAITNFKKQRGPSYNLFIVLLALITFISIITTQYSLIVKYRIDKKEAQPGNIGRKGEIGDVGDNSINLISEPDIINQAIDKYAETLLRIALRQKNPNKHYSENNTYFHNLLIKQSITSAINSWGFRSILISLRDRYLNDLPAKLEHNPDNKQCELEQNDLNNILRSLYFMMQMEIKDWFEIFAKYENGLYFLQQPLLLETDWKTLYSKRDKERGLPNSPFELLEEREIWLWSQLTKKEYLENTRKLTINCDSSNTKCKSSLTINDHVLYYPTISKDENGIYQIQIIETNPENE